MMKKIFALLIALSLFAFIACSDDEDGDVTEYSLSDLYGYTFSASFTASSGTALTPELLIFDEKHLEWNMSSSGMSASQFFYTAEKKATNKYALLWYGSESDYNAKTNAGMTVTLGINSATNITIMVSGDTSEGAGSAMAGKPIEMNRTSAAKRTYSGTDSESQTATIPAITVSGESAEWGGGESYSGTMAVIVSGSNYGNSDTVQTTVTKTEGNTVTVTNPATSAGMGSSAFDITELSVTKDGEIYYLSRTDFEIDVSGTTYACESFKGKLEGGVLIFVFVYKPGAMPMSITEVFTSTN